MKQFAMTPSQLADFKKNGVAGPFDMYGWEEGSRLYRKIRSSLFDRSKAVYDLPFDSVIAGYDRHLDVEEISRHIMRREIVDKLEGILGPDVICWRSELFPKYPGDAGTDWHQTDTYAGVAGEPQVVWPMNSGFGGAITVWTALTDVTEANGCLRFIPGTHEEMIYDETRKLTFDPNSANVIERDGKKVAFFGYNYRNLQKDPDYVPDESLAISMEMKAGQFVMFWSTLMHASFPNITTNQTRMAMVARYVPTCVQIYPDQDVVDTFGSRVSLEKYGVVVVAGEDQYRHNRIVTRSTRGFQFVPGSVPEAVSESV